MAQKYLIWRKDWLGLTNLTRPNETEREVDCLGFALVRHRAKHATGLKLEDVWMQNE